MNRGSIALYSVIEKAPQKGASVARTIARAAHKREHEERQEHNAENLRIGEYIHDGYPSIAMRATSSG